MKDSIDFEKFFFNEFYKNGISTYFAKIAVYDQDDAELVKRSINAGANITNKRIKLKFRLRTRGKWTQSKRDAFKNWHEKEYGKNVRVIYPKEIPVFLADYYVLYVYKV